MDIKALKEQLAEKAKRISELSEIVTREERIFNDEEKSEQTQLETECVELEARIDTAERVERSKRFTAKSQEVIHYKPNRMGDEEKELVFRAKILAKCNRHESLTRDMRKTVERWNINLNDRSQEIVVRDQTSDTSSEGGALLSGSLFDGLVKRVKSYGGIRSVADVQRKPTGQTRHKAYVDTTARKAAIVGQLGTTTNTNVVFSEIEYNSYKYVTGIFPVAEETVTDIGSSFISMMSDMCGEAIGRGQAEHFAVGLGDGSTQPFGLVSECATGKTVVSATAFSFADLVDLRFSVDPAYWDDAVYVMNASTLAYVEKLEDSEGRPVFQENWRNAPELRIKGHPIVIDSNMPSMGEDKKPVVFGSVKRGYEIADVGEMRIRVLEELLAMDGAIGIIGAHRTGARQKDAGAYKALLMNAA